jgi:protein TonB
VIRAVLCAFSLGAVLAALTVGPATGLASLGSSFSRYIDVNFLPARAAAESEAMIVHLPPERLYLSSNLPELETIRVTNSPVTGKTPGAPLRLPDITLQELPGATPSQALQLLRKSFPAYPPAAELRGIEGQVTIEYAIDAMGQVVDPVIIESGPGTVFNRSALQAIRKYRYEPPRVNGKPTGMRGLRTRFVFALDPDPG